MTYVGIVGAGISGLTTAWELKKRDIPFRILEGDQDVGGVWHQKVYDECHLITSRRATSLADAPQPETYPDFPSADQFHAYLRQYADTKGLLPQVRFGARVAEARPNGDGWRVRTDDRTEEQFTHLAVCTGLNQRPKHPVIPGSRSGETLHSGDYRSREQLRGKRVLVLGEGNSACDIAVEAGAVGECAHLSMRRGRWIVPKYAMGIPITDLQGRAPFWMQRKFLQFLTYMQVGRLERFGLPEPDHRLFDGPVLISQLLPYALKHGRVAIRPGVARFDGLDVVFDDDSRGTYDLVVTATGFRPDLSFLDEATVPRGPMGPHTHRWLFSAQHPNLFLNGYYLNNGAFTQVANVAARVIAATVAHDVTARSVLAREFRRDPGGTRGDHVIRNRKQHLRDLQRIEGQLR